MYYLLITKKGNIFAYFVNIFPIQYSLWKDLVFYYLWIDNTDTGNMVSYGLIYDVTLSEVVESIEIKNQGDYIIYSIISHDDGYYPPGRDYFNWGNAIINSFINATNNITNTNKTSNVTGTNKDGGNMEDIVRNSIAFKGNINNLFYVIGAIVLISLLFSVVHSKRN